MCNTRAEAKEKGVTRIVRFSFSHNGYNWFDFSKFLKILNKKKVSFYHRAKKTGRIAKGNMSPSSFTLQPLIRTCSVARARRYGQMAMPFRRKYETVTPSSS